jgi:hypothetical protein
MKATYSIGALFAIAFASVTAFAASNSHQTVSLGLTSTRDKGIVSLATDPVLSDGRLVFRVAAHNPTGAPLQFHASDVKVFTAAGAAVNLLTVDELIADVTGAAPAGSGRSGHDPSAYSAPAVTRNSSGQPDVSNYTGGGAGVTGGISSRNDTNRSKRKITPEEQQQIDALKSAILQTATVEPGKATGGQLVTQKVKFSRKEERAFRVVVDFNGEQHEFNFESPPAK